MKRYCRSLSATLAVLVLVIPLFSLPLGRILADDPYYVYLPVVQREGAEPTSTPTATSTPTQTPLPTATSWPTATPWPTATSIPSTVNVVPNHTSFVDSINYLHVVGEVQNNTSNHLTFVRLTANFFNSSGQLVANDFTYTYLDDVPAWTKTCFEIMLPRPTGWSYYLFETPTYWTTGHALPNLTVTSQSGSYDSTFGWYTIIGMVRNDHGRQVKYVQPVATLYNGTGQPIGCDFTFVNSTDLNAGQTSSFTLTATGRNYSDVASYRLQVDGSPQ